MSLIGDEVRRQFEATQARSRMAPNSAVDNDALQAEIANIDFIPGLVPGNPDREVLVNEQSIMIHETSNFPIFLAAARKYKKATEAKNPQIAIDKLKAEADPLQLVNYANIEKNSELLDSIFATFDLRCPNLYERMAELSAKFDQQVEIRKKVGPRSPEAQTVTGEEVGQARHLFSVGLDEVAAVMQELGMHERIPEMIRLLLAK